MDKELTPEEFKKVMREKEQKAFSILDQQTSQVMKDEALFKKLLNMIAKHVATTASNTLLAQAQLPGATAVTSLQEWEKRNIKVLTDDNGYYPTGIYQIELNGEYLDRATGEVKPKYKVYKGFDASQTNKPDYARSVMNTVPAPTIYYGGQPDTIRNIALYKSSPIRCLIYDPKKLIDPAEYISEKDELRYIPETKTVIIRNVAKDEWFQRVAFEIAMGIYHKMHGSNFKRQTFLFEAGVVSYLLSARAGVDTSTYHFDLTYVSNMELKEFRRMIQACETNAHELAHRFTKRLNKDNQPSASSVSDKKYWITRKKD